MVDATTSKPTDAPETVDDSTIIYDTETVTEQTGQQITEQQTEQTEQQTEQTTEQTEQTTDETTEETTEETEEKTKKHINYKNIDTLLKTTIYLINLSEKKNTLQVMTYYTIQNMSNAIY